jgi:Holliday junction resolvasome RuvABC ATP-dependent DNA helicase subunit
MPATSNGKSATKNTASKAKSTKRSTSTKAPTADKNQVQAVAETVVDLPVGAVLGVTDRISELVDPWTNRTGAEKQIKAYRTQLRRTIKRTERRGTSARRKATTEAKKTRTRVEREARKRQRTVETTLKRNRNEVESRVRKAIDEQTSRAQDLVDQVTEQLSALR